MLLETLLMPEYENVFKPGIIESHDGYLFTKIKPACAKKLLEGAALYAKEPNESSADAERIVANLQRSCGAGNFHL